MLTAGGKAPGPDPLRICIDKLRAVLNNAVGRKLSSLEVHDMCCHIADAVLAGGIRRAAIISLFDRDDLDMLSCKSGDWWEQNPQRGRANNSAVLPRQEVTKEEFDELWERIKNSGSGEPGIFSTNNKEWGVNPCVTGDTLITVRDHGMSMDGEILSEGTIYQIPIKMLVEQYEHNNLPPMILSYNIHTGKVELDYLDAAILTRKDATVIKLVLEDNTELKLTPDHKVFTENRGWIEAKDLTERDILIKIS